MNPSLIMFFNLTIILAGILGILRFTQIHKSYYPFLFCIWLACINEILGAYMANHQLNTLWINNIYVLAEAILLTWFFYNINIFHPRLFILYFFIGILLTGWGLESFFYHTIFKTSIYFRLFYSFFIVVLSLSGIHRIINQERKHLLRNVNFILCFSFALFFTFKILVFGFLLYGLNASRSFLINLYLIMIYINLGTNLLFALAVLWMPKKIAFTLPLSS